VWEGGAWGVAPIFPYAVASRTEAAGAFALRRLIMRHASPTVAATQVASQRIIHEDS